MDVLYFNGNSLFLSLHLYCLQNEMSNGYVNLKLVNFPESLVLDHNIILAVNLLFFQFFCSEILRMCADLIHLISELIS